MFVTTLVLTAVDVVVTRRREFDIRATECKGNLCQWREQFHRCEAFF